MGKLVSESFIHADKISGALFFPAHAVCGNDLLTVRRWGTGIDLCCVFTGVKKPRHKGGASVSLAVYKALPLFTSGNNRRFKKVNG